MRRKSLAAADCPIARTLDVIGDWWTLLIVRDAVLGSRRFSEFQKNLGLSKNILTTRLRNMVKHGILRLAPASDGSAYQEYVLTPRGNGLAYVLIALREWGMDHLCSAEEYDTELLEKCSLRPVGRLAVHTQDGRPLSLEEMVIRRREDDSEGATRQ